MQPFKVFNAILTLICSEIKGIKALSTKTGMSILKKNGTQIKGLHVVLWISILANKGGRATLRTSGVGNFHSEHLTNIYKETAGTVTRRMLNSEVEKNEI